MVQHSGRRSHWLGRFILLAGVTGCATLGWMERNTLLAFYYVHALANATEGERERWVERLADLDRAAVPGLVGCLSRGDERACENAGIALTGMSRRWRPEDARAAELAHRLARGFPRFSLPGQRTALQFASRVLSQANQAEATSAWRVLLLEGLRGDAPEIRSQAAGLTLSPGIGLLDQVVPLLSDPEPSVRRAALVMLGPAENLLATDDLLRWLHDPDEDARRLCEGALRGRGLRDGHLKLGRLITDRRPAVRLEVLNALGQAADLDTGSWLRRLSRDPAPAVRAAAIRAANEHELIELGDRLHEMARSDPSPTVSQLAQFYLSRQEQRRPERPR